MFEHRSQTHLHSTRMCRHRRDVIVCRCLALTLAIETFDSLRTFTFSTANAKNSATEENRFGLASRLSIFDDNEIIVVNRHVNSVSFFFLANFEKLFTVFFFLHALALATLANSTWCVSLSRALTFGSA